MVNKVTITTNSTDIYGMIESSITGLNKKLLDVCVKKVFPKMKNDMNRSLGKMKTPGKVTFGSNGESIRDNNSWLIRQTSTSATFGNVKPYASTLVNGVARGNKPRYIGNWIEKNRNTDLKKRFVRYHKPVSTQNLFHPRKKYSQRYGKRVGRQTIDATFNTNKRVVGKAYYPKFLYVGGRNSAIKLGNSNRDFWNPVVQKWFGINGEGDRIIAGEAYNKIVQKLRVKSKR